MKMNRDYEFTAQLKDHPIGDQHVYRLHYVRFSRAGENYGLGLDSVHMYDHPYEAFMFQPKMKREDGFKVLSYLTDEIEKKHHLEFCSEKALSILNEALDDLGFRKISAYDEKGMIELFTVTGRILLFKKTKYYTKYFEWYRVGVYLEEVKQIYEKCGMNFQELELPVTESELVQKVYKVISKRVR